ncbi:MAG: hypothetical protein PF590_02645 [Candidatus Delongbacteria bacterium]|jgi:hypothetical protein|nr:hypothetical protein [Candidatus Delongbacteria bacterium]
MKKIIFFLVSFFFANFMMAQSVIVLHSTDTTAGFTGNTAFADAYALAQTGDTLYLSGGAFTMSSEIAKGLKIFGAGIHPDSTSATYITQLSGDVDIRNGADGLYFEGIQFAHGIRENYTHVVDDVSFVRCKFISTLDFGISGTPAVLRENYAFIQSVFLNRLDMEGVTNSLITNCIFNDRIYNSNSNSIKNSSFLYNPSSASYDIIDNSNTNLISNCIFHATSSYIIDGASNTIQNCVTQDAAPGYGSTPIDVNNYKGIDLSTVFIALPSEPFSFDDNYHLTPSAETTYLGDDGTQVGIYGGLFPLKEGFVPQNPHISTKTISSGTDENGFLNVDVEVNAQDN